MRVILGFVALGLLYLLTQNNKPDKQELGIKINRPNPIEQENKHDSDEYFESIISKLSYNLSSLYSNCRDIVLDVSSELYGRDSHMYIIISNDNNIYSSGFYIIVSIFEDEDQLIIEVYEFDEYDSYEVTNYTSMYSISNFSENLNYIKSVVDDFIDLMPKNSPYLIDSINDLESNKQIFSPFTGVKRTDYSSDILTKYF